jgi:A/G-specific adenine glycosylase
MNPEEYVARLERIAVGDATWSRQKSVFRRIIRSFYREHGRAFPWRNIKNPYRILVSEVMLQQTQTSRVLERYPMFLRQFPTVKALARAPLQEVLSLWEGMGYYRRARNLHASAQTICADWNGRVPRTAEGLRTLPGIGEYTAAAVSAFAFNISVPMIETNIRSVYLHTFFQDKLDVQDSEIMNLIQETMDCANPRDWFYALMDVGVVIKRLYPSINKSSRHYSRQSPYVGSSRELAAKILRSVVGESSGTSIESLSRILQVESHRIQEQVARLVKDRLLHVSERGIIRCL